MAQTRSPNFPYIPLEQALARAAIIWQHEHRHDVAPETVVEHWGYSPKSSGGRQTIAALRHFGLLEGRGDKIRLTQLAQSIMLGEQGSPQWLQDLREAALRPSVHKEIWDKYDGHLPSDQNLRRYLIMERSFSEGGAAELISELRATFEFAKLEEGEADNLFSGSGDNFAADEPMASTFTEHPLSNTRQRSNRQIQLPYSPTAWAVLQASFPLTDDEWDQMLAVLTAMRPALVKQDD
jgi:hypothetical protein